MPTIGLTLDCADAQVVANFWKLALGYEDKPPPAPFATYAEWIASFGEEYDPHGGAWLRDPSGRLPPLSILQVPEPKTVKNRLHLDVDAATATGVDERWAQITAEVARLTAAGARTLHEEPGHHVVLADPEGNEFCVR